MVRGVGGPLGQSDRFGLDSDTPLPSRCGQMSLLTLSGSSENEAAAGPPPGLDGQEVVIRVSVVTDPPRGWSEGTDPGDAFVRSCSLHAQWTRFWAGVGLFLHSELPSHPLSLPVSWSK